MEKFGKGTTTVRRFICSQCGYGANSNYKLQMHNQIHSEEREFKCDQCPYAAKQRQGLAAHIDSMHRPHRIMCQCPLCGEMFKGVSNLKSHIARVHENLRPHHCPLCEKAFKQKMHLKYHLKTHENPNGRKRSLNKEREPKRRRDQTSAKI